jgi:hypothetical protein
MKDKKPAVIAASELASILGNFAKSLRAKPEDLFLVAHDSKPRVVQGDPSLSIVIKFDRETLKAKTISVSNAKTAVKEWNAAHHIVR